MSVNVLTFVSGGVALIFAALIAILWVKVSKLTRYHELVLGGLERSDVAEAIFGYINDVRALNIRADDLTTQIQGAQNKMRGCVQNMGYVRYDAFNDIGGQLSFSLALLNAEGDGFVISSINGRAESRIYAKTVLNGDAGNLSDEEKEAVKKALNLRKTGLM